MLWGPLWKEIMLKNRAQAREREGERASEGVSERKRKRERLSQTSMAALCKWLTSPDVKLNRETLMSCVYLKSLGPILRIASGRSRNHVDEVMAEN